MNEQKIKQIEKIFGARFENKDFDKAISGEREALSTNKESLTNLNDSNVKWLKLPVIKKIKKCNAKTPPIEIANLLICLFGKESQSGHWLWIARHYYPLTIYRVLKQMKNRQEQGWESIKNPPAYFTYKIKLRKRRRCFYK